INEGPAALLPEPTGWPKVDSMRRTVAVRVAQATSEHDYQGVGHLCRETLIALAEAVYDPVRHRSADGRIPSPSDAEERLNSYLSVELGGSAHGRARRAVKAVLAFANAVQHDQGATLREAALVAEATNGIINLVAIVGGRRDKPLESIRVEL